MLAADVESVTLPVGRNGYGDGYGYGDGNGYGYGYGTVRSNKRRNRT